MKTNNKKYFNFILIITSVILMVICFVNLRDNVSAKWKEDDKGKLFILDDGKEAVGFQTIEDQTYYFDKDGYLQTGKIYIEEEDVYYYADENGIILTGVIDKDGVFFVADDTGKIQVGFVEYDGKRYYFNTRAEQLFGWFKLGEDWYYADEDGVIRTGFITIDGYRYYLGDEGKRVSDTVMEIDGTTYIFSADGSVDENATMLYPLYKYISDQRKTLGLGDILLDNKVQACAVVRATGLSSGFGNGNDNSIENMLKNRGIKSNGGYEFSYGGVEGYGIEQLISNLQIDERFLSALKDAGMNASGIGMHSENDIYYFDIILVDKE